MTGVAWAALAISIWRAAADPTVANGRLAFVDRVDVRAPGVAEPLLTPLTRGADLSRRDLIALGGDVTRAFDIAADAAGAFTGARRVRVDGMVSPSAGRASGAGVSVQSDPFSVEFGGLDQIEFALDTPPPSRRWAFTAAPPTWRSGGADPLTDRAPDSRRITASVAGPGPIAPLTFFASGDQFIQSESRAFASPDAATFIADDRAVTDTRVESAAGGVAWSGAATLLRATLGTSRTDVDNAGVGGLMSADAAFALRTGSTQAQVTWDVSRRLRHRGGVRFVSSTDRTSATQGGPAIVSAAEIVTGSEVLSRAARQTAWALRHVTHPSNRRWLAGAEIQHENMAESRLYNPMGVLRLTADGRSTSLLTASMGEMHLRSSSAAAFAQGIVPVGPRAALRAGIRAEWLDSEGVFLSPRLSLGATAKGFVLTAAAALSAEEWSAGALASLAWRRDDVARYSVDGRPLRLVVADSFARRRDAIVRLGAARQIGRVQAAVDHTWTRGSHLGGTTRTQTGDALFDTLAGDRALARHQTHVTARTRVGVVSIVGHYEALHSYDNTDGWLSPDVQSESGNEWARTSALPRHHGSIVLSGQLPGSVHLLAAWRSSSGRPHSVLSGLDPSGLGVFTDRGGYARNGEETPGWSSLNVYLSRSFRIPLAGTTIDTGVRVENALNTTRVDEVGRVLATPLFGRALAVGQGRSASVWFALARR